MAKKPSVLDELEAITPRARTWLERATPEAREKMLEIKRLWKAGKCDYPKRTIHEFAHKIGIKVAHDTLRRWLDEKA